MDAVNPPYGVRPQVAVAYAGASRTAHLAKPPDPHVLLRWIAA
jgi:hypothetical protein